MTADGPDPAGDGSFADQSAVARQEWVLVPAGASMIHEGPCLGPS
jgi:hypothetical protein